MTEAEPRGSGSRIGAAAALALALSLFAFLAWPRVSSNPRLAWTFIGTGGALSCWALVIVGLAWRRRAGLPIELVLVPAHYVQAAVQLCIILYWGWYSTSGSVRVADGVYAQMPLILAQVVFLYALDALLSWTRGRTWRLGFGPLPIIFSTNLLLWFKDDWFFFQLAMVALGALAKQFITWNRDGRRMHIFNPSVFGQFLFAIALIATSTTTELTWGREIAATFEAPPHIYIVIFLLGLVVQSLFQVTLMTLSAAAVLCILNLGYTEATGTYWFLATNIGSPIFLGIHLLLTDPSTSPRTNVGKVVFGGLYAASYFALYRILDHVGVPLFWDKLLPVPFLNLCVPLIDRASRFGAIGRINAAWEHALSARVMNRVHMGVWTALFATMIVTGYIEGPHQGNSIAFWKQAYVEGRPNAGRSLLKMARYDAGRGSGAACNEVGVIYIEGAIAEAGGTTETNHARAARYFARASDLGDLNGSANVVTQYLFLHEARSDEDVLQALDALERHCPSDKTGRACFLVGYAYETGAGRPVDPGRALELYHQGLALGDTYAFRGVVRVRLSTRSGPRDLALAARLLDEGCALEDLECCYYLAYAHHLGLGVARDEPTARALLQKACAAGFEAACMALKTPEIPTFLAPTSPAQPPWSTAWAVKPGELYRAK